MGHLAFGHKIWDGIGLVALKILSIGFCTILVTKETPADAYDTPNRLDRKKGNRQAISPAF